MALYTSPIARVFDSNVRVGVGYKLFFYAAGTTTAKDTFTDNTYTTALPNPVIADGFGRFPEIWTTGYYKVRLTDASDVAVWTVDNYTTDSGASIFAESVQTSVTSTANEIAASLSVSIESLNSSLQVVVELDHVANTNSAPTFNLNGLGPVLIQRQDGKPLRIGDTGGAGAKIYLAYASRTSTWILLNPAIPTLLGKKWIEGLHVTNNASTPNTDFDISVGQAADTNDNYMIESTFTWTKTTAPYLKGNGNGALSSVDTLSERWYGVYVISRASSPSDSEIVLATSTANSLLDVDVVIGGYNISRLVGYILTGPSPFNIVQHVNGGDGLELWLQAINAGISQSSTRVSQVVEAPPFQVAQVNYAIFDNGSTSYGILTQLDQTDVTPNSSSNSTLSTQGASGVSIYNSINARLKVNASSQIGYRNSSGLNGTFLKTEGYIIDRSITDLV